MHGANMACTKTNDPHACMMPHDSTQLHTRISRTRAQTFKNCILARCAHPLHTPQALTHAHNHVTQWRALTRAVACRHAHAHHRCLTTAYAHARDTPWLAATQPITHHRTHMHACKNVTLLQTSTLQWRICCNMECTQVLTRTLGTTQYAHARLTEVECHG